DPLALFGAPATYSFPDSGSPAPFGIGYRIQAPASPDPVGLGFGRAGSLRFDSFLSAPAVDMYVVGWDNRLDESFGILTKVTSLGRGTTDGYAFTYSTAGILSLSRIDNEQFTVLASAPATLDPSRSYRFVFLA